MQAYSGAYLNDVVENQGKLFDYIAQEYPDKDTTDFINAYMSSKTRKSIDEGSAYLITMDVRGLWQYFSDTEKYTLQSGKAIEGFVPDWMGEFYAYYQWYYNVASSSLIKDITVDFLMKAYGGLHNLDLELAVKKVGKV